MYACMLRLSNTQPGSELWLAQMGKAISEETNMQKQITDNLVRGALLCSVADTLLAFRPALSRSRLLQGDVLERSNAALRQGMRKLNRAYKQSKSNHLLWLALFTLAIVFAVWLFAKTYRTIRWFV